MKGPPVPPLSHMLTAEDLAELEIAANFEPGSGAMFTPGQIRRIVNGIVALETELSRLRALVAEQGEELVILREVADQAESMMLIGGECDVFDAAECRACHLLEKIRAWRSKREGPA